MSFLARLGKFWLILVVLAGGMYFCVNNLAPITIHWPDGSTSEVKAAVAYAVSFLAGATTVTVFFGYEMMRKSWELKRATRRLNQLKKSEPAISREPKESELITASPSEPSLS